MNLKEYLKDRVMVYNNTLIEEIDVRTMLNPNIFDDMVDEYEEYGYMREHAEVYVEDNLMTEYLYFVIGERDATDFVRDTLFPVYYISELDLYLVGILNNCCDWSDIIV